MSRIGVYAGTFDPVHAGHVAFALQAIQEARLDRLYFLPERRPRLKKDVEHFAHRVAMLNRAAAPHPSFAVLELEDVSFSVEHTLPRLYRRFPHDELIFLFGSDVTRRVIDWPMAERMLTQHELVVGVRDNEDAGRLVDTVAAWSTQPKRMIVFESHAPEVSSTKIRHGLRQKEPVTGLLPSVERYSEHNWLYVSLSRPVGVDKP